MTVNYTTNLALGQPVTGTESGTWGDDVNNSVTSYLDIAIAGGLAITITTTDVTLTLTQGTSSATNIGSTTAQYAILNVSGAMTAARNLILPSSSRQYIINNNTTGGFALTVKGAATSGVTMINGEKAQVFWNGSDYAKSAITTAVVNGIVYINSSGQAISGSALTFDGTNFATTGTATATKLIPTGTSVTGNGMYLPATNALGFSTNGTNAVYIDASQNVGIGTSSPAGKLDIVEGSRANSTNIGNININTNSTAAINLGGSITLGGTYNTASSTSFAPFGSIRGAKENSTSGNYAGYLQFNTIANADVLTERMRIDSSGNLLIGYTSSNGAYKLQVNSQIFATSSTIATSDARYKENVEELLGALDIVKALRPVSFDWKAHPVHNFDTKTKTVGFLAQDVQQALAGKPYLNSIIKANECVIEPEIKDEEGNVTKQAVTEEFLGIAEGNMISILTAAIKEQQALITTLTARIEALEAK